MSFLTARRAVNEPYARKMNIITIITHRDLTPAQCNAVFSMQSSIMLMTPLFCISHTLVLSRVNVETTVHSKCRKKIAYLTSKEYSFYGLERSLNQQKH